MNQSQMSGVCEPAKPKEMYSKRILDLLGQIQERCLVIFSVSTSIEAVLFGGGLKEQEQKEGKSLTPRGVLDEIEYREKDAIQTLNLIQATLSHIKDSL